MFQTPSLILVTIAATRIYRNLINFGFSLRQGSPLVLSSKNLTVVDDRSSSHEIPGGTGLAVSDMRFRPGPISVNRVEVTAHMEYEQYPASQISRYVSKDTQGQYKAHKVSLEADVASLPEK
jgi:hypothetical protein